MLILVLFLYLALPTDRGAERYRPDGPRAATYDPRANKGRGGSVPFAELEDDNNLAPGDSDASVNFQLISGFAKRNVIILETFILNKLETSTVLLL